MTAQSSYSSYKALHVPPLCHYESLCKSDESLSSPRGTRTKPSSVQGLGFRVQGEAPTNPAAPISYLTRESPIQSLQSPDEAQGPATINPHSSRRGRELRAAEAGRPSKSKTKINDSINTNKNSNHKSHIQHNISGRVRQKGLGLKVCGIMAPRVLAAYTTSVFQRLGVDVRAQGFRV